MITIIHVIYTDRQGTITAEISNDAKELTLILEGIVFKGRSFDDMEPQQPLPPSSRFALDQLNQLTDCFLLLKIPISLSQKGKEVAAALIVDMKLSMDLDFDSNFSFFRLAIGDEFIDIGKAQHFESTFEMLKLKLPEDVYPRCCYNCLYSDYSVYGSGIFGTMLCFKSEQEQYLSVKTKDDYMNMMHLDDGLVQETYLCSAFEKRLPGTGYRG